MIGIVGHFPRIRLIRHNAVPNGMKGSKNARSTLVGYPRNFWISGLLGERAVFTNVIAAVVVYIGSTSSGIKLSVNLEMHIGVFYSLREPSPTC